MTAPEMLPLDWQPTQWPDTESANHAVRGFYMLQPSTRAADAIQVRGPDDDGTPRADKQRWTLYYDMAEIGHYASRDEARDAAASHHRATQRAFAWERYMAAYDPPDAGERL